MRLTKQQTHNNGRAKETNLRRKTAIPNEKKNKEKDNKRRTAKLL